MQARYDTTTVPSSRGLAPLDPRIRYPSYRSFDDFIDIERLRSLDRYIRLRIENHIHKDQDPKFYTGPYTLADENAGRPGSRMIYLSKSDLPDNYFDLDRTEVWHPTAAANEFEWLMEFIATLPFQATGRMLIMYDDEPREVPAHRDHTRTETLHEFIWLRTNLIKPFYMLNCETGEREPVRGYSAWFDTVNQYHGSDPVERLTFSIRVDGVFTDEFRRMIPKPEYNAASTPSFWACTNEQGDFNERGPHHLH